MEIVISKNNIPIRLTDEDGCILQQDIPKLRLITMIL